MAVKEFGTNEARAKETIAGYRPVYSQATRGWELWDAWGSPLRMNDPVKGSSVYVYYPGAAPFDKAGILKDFELNKPKTFGEKMRQQVKELRESGGPFP